MPNFGFTSAIRAMNSEYLLQTSNNDFEKKIFSSLFKNGGLVISKEIDYDPHISEEALLTLVKNFHSENRSGFESLLTLSERLSASKNAESKNALGLALFYNNLYSEAIREFKDVIKLKPNFSQAYNNLGRVYLAVGAYDEAILVFERAIHLNPDYADYHKNLGIAHFRKKHCRSAITEFEKAAKINPYYWEAFFYLGLTYILNSLTKEDFSLTINLYQRTMMYLERAANLHPRYKNQHYILGQQYLQQGKLEEAFQEFNKALSQAGNVNDKGFILNFYLKYLSDEGNVNLSMIWKHIKNLQKLLKRHPGYADLYNDLGIAYTILCKFVNNLAIQYFEEATKINPKYQRAQKNLKLAKYESKGFEPLLEAVVK